MEIEKVRWQCRRGMLELDILLLPFVDKCYSALSAEQQETFVQLLKQTDQELYLWLLGRAVPPTAAFVSIVKLICEKRWDV